MIFEILPLVKNYRKKFDLYELLIFSEKNIFPLVDMLFTYIF